MKKRLIGLAFVALGALTLASCGGGVTSKEYKNNITKGNKVDSISFEYMDRVSGTVKNLNISSTDTYKVMIEKLTEAYRNNYGPTQKYDSCYPLYESATRIYKSSVKNGVFLDVEKTSNGRIDNKQNGDYVTGDHTIDRNTSVNSTLYLYGSNSEIFFMDNYKMNETEEYNNIPASTLKDNIFDERNNQGVYFKYTGSPREGGSKEYATNNASASGIRFTDVNETPKDFKMYFTTSWEAKDPDRDTVAIYTSEDQKMELDTSYLGVDITMAAGQYMYNYAGSPFYITSFNLENSLRYVDVSEYYENSFELTDKYLIIKNKVNTSDQALNAIVESGYPKEQMANYLKPYEGSYSYKEVWLNYKDVKKDDNVYSLGYDYFKEDYIEKRVSEIVLSKDTVHNVDEATLERLGVNGKVSTINALYENHYESYRIDVSDGEINNLKNSFINSCKDGNYFTKYKFTKSSTRFI